MDKSSNTISETRKVSVGLIIGIILLPFIFVWFLLKQGYSKKAKIIGFIWLAIWVIIAISSGNKSDITDSNLDKTNSKVKSEDVNPLSIGESAKYEDFLVTFNGFEIRKSFKVNNMVTWPTSLGKEPNTEYAIIDVSFKNESNETQGKMATGELWLITSDNQKIIYDSEELIVWEGFGSTFLEAVAKQTKQQKIVYKIPSDIQGHFYYVLDSMQPNLRLDCGIK